MDIPDKRKIAKWLTVWTTVFIALAFIVGIGYRLYYFLLHPLMIGPDQSVYLAMGELLLSGKVPYRDFYDFNLPSIIYWSTIPVLLGRLGPVPLAVVFNFFVYFNLLLSLMTLGAIFWLFRKHIDSRFCIPVMAGLVFLQQMILYDIGQREHLFVLFYLPYFFLRYFRLTAPDGLKANLNVTVDRLISVLCGLFALAVYIKPYFLAYIIPLEIATYIVVGAGGIKNKILSALEVKVFLIGTVLYLLHFALYPAEALSILFTHAFPLYTTGAYWYQNSSIACLSCLDNFYVITIIFLASLFLAIPLSRQTKLIAPLLCFNSIGFFIYIFFSTAWTYRYLPVLGGSLILLFVEIWLLCAMCFSKCRNLPALVGLILYPPLALVAVCIFAWQQVSFYTKEVLAVETIELHSMGQLLSACRRETSPVFLSLLKLSKANDKVVAISSGVFPGYPPVVLTGRQPGSRYLHGMLLPMLDISHQRASDESGEKYRLLLDEAVKNYGADIIANKPVLIYIQGGEIREILEDRHFSELYLKDYQDLGDLGFESLRVFRLKDDQAGALAKVSPALLERVVFDILAGKMTIEEASRKNSIDKERLEILVRNMQTSANEALSNTPGGGDISALSKLLQANKLLLEKDQEIMRLKRQAASDKNSK